MPKKIVPTNQKGIKDFFLIRMNPTKMWLQFIASINHLVFSTSKTDQH